MILRCRSCKREDVCRLAVDAKGCPCGGTMKPVACFDSSPPVPRGGKFTCFWCGDKFWNGERTRDHVHPLGLGGENRRGNVVNSCYECNQDRGKIVCHIKVLSEVLDIYARAPDLERWEMFKLRLWVKRIWGKIDKWRERLAYWREMEMAKLGWSPCEKIDFWLPSVEEVARITASIEHEQST